MSMLLEYIRDNNKQPIGCVVAIPNNLNSYGFNLGYSLLNPKDRFNKELAKRIAVGRAETFEVDVLLEKVGEKFDEYFERNQNAPSPRQNNFNRYIKYGYLQLKLDKMLSRASDYFKVKGDDAK